MSSENGKTSVIDLQEKGILLVEDGNHGEYRPLKNEFCEIGTAFIRAADLGDGEVGFGSAEKINTDASLRIRKGIGKEGDVLISHKGTLGKIGFVREGSPPFVCSPQTTFWRVLNEQVIDRYYLFAYMRSPQFKRVFSVCGGETDMAPYVSLTSQRLIELRLPQIGIQRAIGEIVRSLDDKIELNRKTNETLEAMAKALFKSWFVDFDPVRAKAEGRPTGFPADISDLFPDSFEDSELGEIPSGWRCSPLADQTTYLSRGISPAYCDEGGVLLLNQKCIRNSRVSFEKARRHDTTRKQIIGREVRRFDALVNSTGVGTLGRVAMMPICLEEAVVDSHVTVVRGGNTKESFFISSTLLNRQIEIESLGEGSTGQTELSRVVLGSLLIIFPSSELISAYFDCTYTIQDKIEKNDQANVALASTRDALLPKLISGEIRIPDAEKMLEEVGI
jgi:type I restriction enzyme S subunit